MVDKPTVQPQVYSSKWSKLMQNDVNESFSEEKKRKLFLLFFCIMIYTWSRPSQTHSTFPAHRNDFFLSFVGGSMECVRHVLIILIHF